MQSITWCWQYTWMHYFRRPCTGWPNSAWTALLLFLSVCISSYSIQAGLYWKLWAWSDILPFKIKFDFSRCIFRNQINDTSLKQSLSPVLLQNIVPLWCVWLRVPRFGDMNNWRDLTENHAAQSCVILLIHSACAAGHWKSFNMWCWPCISPTQNSQNSKAIKNVNS